jgi:guanidinopropionase
VGGLTPREVLAILRGVAGAHIIGGDVMEVAPQYDSTTNTAQVAAQMLFTELCLVALDPGFLLAKQKRGASLAR